MFTWRSPRVCLSVPQFPPPVRTRAHLLTSFHLIILYEDPMSKEGRVRRYWELGLHDVLGDIIPPLSVVLGRWGRWEAGVV